MLKINNQYVFKRSSVEQSIRWDSWKYTIEQFTPHAFDERIKKYLTHGRICVKIMKEFSLKTMLFSEQHDIEYALWQLHYRRIEELRALFAAAASAGSPAPQNGKGTLRALPDRLTKIRTQFKTFLSEATGFYHDLMLKIRSKYGLPLGYSSDDPENQIPMSSEEHFSCLKEDRILRLGLQHKFQELQISNFM